MMTERDKNRLAFLNGLTEERYGDKVKEAVKKIYPHLQDEIAFLRKEIAYLRGVIEENGIVL